MGAMKEYIVTKEIVRETLVKESFVIKRTKRMNISKQLGFGIT